MDFSLRSVASVTLGLLVGMLLMTTVTATVTRALNERATHALTAQSLPARVKAAELREAYRRLHLAQTALLLTGAPRFATASSAGFRHVSALTAAVRSLVAQDQTATDALAATDAAAQHWHAALRSATPTSGAVVPNPGRALAILRGAEHFFTDIRLQLGALSDRIVENVRDRLESISARQHLADVVSWISMTFAVVLGVSSLRLRRRVLTTPVDELTAQLGHVADGAYQRPIALAGAPTELSRIADASETMRESLVRGAGELAAAQRELALQKERERFAADLHDHAVQEVFALGLSLSSVASSHPEITGLLSPMIDQTDKITRQLRTVIFDVRDPAAAGALSVQLRTLCADSARVLGFAPLLAINSAALDSQIAPGTAAELLAALRESLSNVVRHAHASRVDIAVTIDNGVLELDVIDDGVGVDPTPTRAGHGLVNLRRRAQRLGGDAQVIKTPGGGTTVIWRVDTGTSDSRPHREYPANGGGAARMPRSVGDGTQLVR